MGSASHAIRRGAAVRTVGALSGMRPLKTPRYASAAVPAAMISQVSVLASPAASNAAPAIQKRRGDEVTAKPVIAQPASAHGNELAWVTSVSSVGDAINAAALKSPAAKPPTRVARREAAATANPCTAMVIQTSTRQS